MPQSGYQALALAIASASASSLKVVTPMEHTHPVVALEQGWLDVITRGERAFEFFHAAAAEYFDTFLLGDLQVANDARGWRGISRPASVLPSAPD